MREKSRLFLSGAIVAGLLGLAASQALAQGPDPYAGGPDESVTVTAPHYRFDNTRLNAPPGRLSLSVPVTYTTQDLLDPERAQALRRKVWQTAHEVCAQLNDAYPLIRSTSAPKCFRDAYYDAMIKIDARMTGARLAYWYGY